MTEPEPEYKPAHERASELNINEMFGKEAALPYCRIDARKDRRFTIERGVLDSRNRIDWTSVTIHDPDAAREIAAHLLAWADQMEENDE